MEPNIYLPQDDGDTDEDAGHNARHPRINPFDMYNRKQFRKRYRLTKPLALFVLRDYAHSKGLELGGPQETRGGALNIETRFCISLRYLATGSFMTSVGDTHGVSLSSVSRYLEDFVEYLYRNSHKYIKWPYTEEEKIAVSSTFEQHTTKPRCLGIVDGTHVPIRKPHINAPAYFGKPNKPTLNVMVVCNFDKVFTHIDPTWAGSVQDAYVFNSSEVKLLSMDGDLDPFFLIADKGYGCQRNLFPPILTPSNDKERAFNKWHRKTRVLVEMAIGQLKNRWRCLDDSGGYLYHEPSVAGKIVIACCCLHNLCEQFHVPMAMPENDEVADASDDSSEEDDNQEMDEDDMQDLAFEHITRQQYINEFF